MFVAVIFNGEEVFEISVWCLGVVQIAKAISYHLKGDEAEKDVGFYV